MAATDSLPRFFKIFVSCFSSESMKIPSSYYDELPNRLSKTAILQGPGGGSWKVALIKNRDEVHFGEGWSRFVEDNRLCDGNLLTFVYNGDRIFEVSIFRNNGCKDLEKEEDEDDKEDGVSITSKDTDAETQSEMASRTPRSKNKGKSKEIVVVDSDSTEAFGSLDVSEDSNNGDRSYSPDIGYTTACIVKPKEKGKSKAIEKAKASDGRITSKKVIPRIKNPETYLVDPNNLYFETNVKNRQYELLVKGQLVNDYDLKFEEIITYIDKNGELPVKAKRWSDGRVVIKKWDSICKRNKLRKEDAVLCELLREKDVVYAVRIHIVRENDL